MWSLLHDYLKNNQWMKLIFIITSLPSIFCEPLFLYAMSRFSVDGLSSSVVSLLLSFSVLRIIQTIKSNIIDNHVIIDFASFLRNKYVRSLIKNHPKSKEEYELFVDKYIDKIASFYIDRINLIESALSFLLINGVLLFNGRLTTIFTLLISVLGLMMSLLYTRKTQEKYKRYLDSEVDSVDFQNNLIDNHITAQNEGAVPFLISQLEQKMSKEYAAKETNVNNHLFPKRLTEISYILSNVFLPSISFALVLVHMEAPIFLPTIILLSPRITSIINAFISHILSSKEIKVLVNSYKHEITMTTTKQAVYWSVEKKASGSITIRFIIPYIEKNASIAINGNGLYCITGASGSGKTTILKTLLNCLEDSDTFPMTDVLYLSIDGFYLVDSTIENISIITGRDVKLLTEEIEIFCNKIGVNMDFFMSRPGERYNNLSDGQKKLVSLFVLLNSGAKIALIDEPTANLDRTTKEIIIRMIIEAAYNKIIVATTHDKELSIQSKQIISL